MPPLNFNHFYYFYEVARHRSFTKAARALLISQSALSVQVSNLEAQLGVALLERRKGGVELTDEGQAPFQVAERAFQDVDRMMTELQSKGSLPTVAFSLATVNSIGIFVLPAAIASFREAFPEERIKMTFLEGDSVIERVISGRADFALVTWSGRYSELEGVRLAQHKMFLVAAPGHPMTRTDGVSPRELEGHPFIGYPEGFHTRGVIDALFKRLRVSVEYATESTNAATILHMVMAGVGVAILPEYAVTTELRRGHVVRIDIPAMATTQELMLYYRRSRALAGAREQFLNFMVAHFGPSPRRK